jgi:general L-amino acid transport system permease protein
MSDTAQAQGSIAYVRTDEAPLLPAPASTVGIQGWLRANLFSSAFNSVLTIVLGAALAYYLWGIIDWAIIRAIWSGTDRTACLVEGGGITGACWPVIYDKFPQWVYGFYPLDQRWRVNLVFALAIIGLVPMMIPSVPYKKWNALYLLLVFPLVTLVLLTGGNFNFSAGSYFLIIGILLVAAALLPIALMGVEDGLSSNRLGALLAGIGILPIVIALVLLILGMIVGIAGAIAGWLGFGMLRDGMTALATFFYAIDHAVFAIPGLVYIVGALVLAGAILSMIATSRLGGTAGIKTLTGWLAAAIFVMAAMFILDFDFGLEPVETDKWGGLLVTLVVSVTGMVASLPLGILLALGRRSEMPVVKMFSVMFIELWRGVPLITVLFFSSVMLPLFLPEGTSFDKLLRALVGVALFSAAYMAEVVRSGLQAIPKGQYEGAQALGLSYWQTMSQIILPQALKISIPNIVGNFISLFKDTTLVSIIGLFDLLGMARAGLKDANWAGPSTVPTGYFSLAMMFWIFCFAMSRYSMYTERRLNTGHKR